MVAQSGAIPGGGGEGNGIQSLLQVSLCGMRYTVDGSMCVSKRLV